MSSQYVLAQHGGNDKENNESNYSKLITSVYYALNNNNKKPIYVEVHDVEKQTSKKQTQNVFLLFFPAGRHFFIKRFISGPTFILKCGTGSCLVNTGVAAFFLRFVKWLYL